MLDEAMDGRVRAVPFDAVQAMDVILRHLPSLKYTPVGRSFFSPPLAGGAEGAYGGAGARALAPMPQDMPAKLGGGREVWFGKSYFLTLLLKQMTHSFCITFNLTFVDKFRLPPERPPISMEDDVEYRW